MSLAIPPVWAAGAVLLRGGREAPEVALVYRPRYDDWSLPKGKANRTELLPLTAVREVAEETGILIRLGPELTPQRYLIPGGLKIVSYWRGIALAAVPHVPDEEVDEVAWFPLERAYETMTYSNERAIVAEAAALADTTPLLIVRHARAVNRSQWHGDDAQRPLEERGRLQVPYLDQVLQAYGVARLISSPTQRCLQTVSHYARRDDLTIEEVPLISETEGIGHDAEVTAYMSRLARSVGTQEVPTALCTHRPILPALLAGLDHPPRPLATCACLIAHVDRHGHAVRVEWQETLRVKAV
jgi:8-oxo-dGTP diphosphatase